MYLLNCAHMQRYMLICKKDAFDIFTMFFGQSYHVVQPLAPTCCLHPKTQKNEETAGILYTTEATRHSHSGLFTLRHFTLRFVYSEVCSQRNGFTFLAKFDTNQKGGGNHRLLMAASVSLSLVCWMFWSKVIRAWCASWVRRMSHSREIFSSVQHFLGLPTSLVFGIRGMALFDAKVTWCSGCCLSRRSTWPSSFSLLLGKISVSGLIFRSGPTLVDPCFIGLLNNELICACSV